MAAAQHGDAKLQRVMRTLALRHGHLFLCATILLCLSLVLCAPILRYGAPDGADAGSALMWTRGFATQLSQGDWYPRWLMDINHGAGSPAFYFYAPLPFYIGSLTAVLLPHQSLNVQLAWTDWVLLLSSGATFFGCVCRHVSTQRALLSSALYMVLPYHFETDLWVREDLGELTNYIWMPLVFNFTDRVLNQRNHPPIAGLAVSYALMVFSHLPSTLLFSICLAVYAVTCATILKSAAPLVRFTQAIAVGTLVSGIYWVPAIFSQQYIHAEAWWSSYYDFHLWFFPVRPLSAFGGDVETRDFNMRQFLVISATTVIFTVFWLVAWKYRSPHNKARLTGCALLIGAAWFLMTPLSSFIWEHCPPLAKVQFPSRLAMIVDFGTAIVASNGLPPGSRREWTSTAAVAISILLLIWCISTARLTVLLDPFNEHAAIVERDDRVRGGVDAPEYTTQWSPFDPKSEDNSHDIIGMDMVSYDTTAGVITPTVWRPRELQLTISLKKATLLTVRQFYFPNWKAVIIEGAALKVVPSRATGLINVMLPPGAYSVRLRLESSLQERLGDVTSCVGLLMLGALMNWYKRRRSDLCGALS